jgi:predicted lipid-binding transport protein (Tim44 family)
MQLHVAIMLLISPAILTAPLPSLQSGKSKGLLGGLLGGLLEGTGIVKGLLGNDLGLGAS